MSRILDDFNDINAVKKMSIARIEYFCRRN